MGRPILCSNHFFGFFFGEIVFLRPFPVSPILFLFTFLLIVSLFSSQGAFAFRLVGSNGLEPSTSRLSGARSNHLSYEPISVAGSAIGQTCCSKFLSLRIPLANSSVSACRNVGHSDRQEDIAEGSRSETSVVETNRIELSTPCLQGRCSPS